MDALIISVTVFATVMLCLAFGILCGYASVIGILRLFGHHSEKPQSSSRRFTTAPVSGD